MAVDTCVRYVDADSSVVIPSGLTWQSPFRDIQSGINSAAAAMVADGGDSCQVWIKDLPDGDAYIFTPEMGVDTYTIPSGISLLGGFLGGETDVNQRALENHSRVHCNAPSDANTRGDICLTLQNAENVVLNGISLSYGQVSVLAENSNVRFENVWMSNFDNDTVFDGNGVLVARKSTVTLTDSSTDQSGAANGIIVHATESNVHLSGMVGSGLYASGAKGGAIYAVNSSITIDSGSGFTAQYSEGNGDDGGVIYSVDSTVSVSNASIGNSHIASIPAGGIVYMERSEYAFSNVTFGIYDQPENTFIKGMILAANESEGTISNSELRFTNSECVQGFFYNRNSSMTIINSDFSGLQFTGACPDSGILYVDNPDTGKVTVVNSIFWNTGDANIVYEPVAPAEPTEISYSIVQGGFVGDGNIDVSYDTDDDLTLDSDSPVIDAGNGDVAPEFDMEGNPRVDVAGVPNTGVGTPAYTDIGPREYQP